MSDQLRLEPALEAAVAIAHAAGRILTSYFGSDRVAAQLKGTRDVVTAADVASEALVVRRLRDSFPGDGIEAEEGSGKSSQTGRCWYIDPLDGTMNYSRGIPLWCVSIGLLDHDEPVLGVIHDPIRGETFRAAKGLGAWLGERRLGCSRPDALADAVVHLTIDFNEHSMKQGMEDVVRVAPQVLRTRNLGSAALALAYVAAGRLDGMLHRYAHTWDYAAGATLIAEAGGLVTDIQGAPFDARTLAIAAAGTARVHTGLIELASGPESTPLQ